MRLIGEELQHLAHNIAALPALADSPPPPVPLRALLRLALEDTRAALSSEMNDLLFRLYILEESTALVLLKALRAAQQLSERADEPASRHSSSNSARSGKRSALSESLEVFKRSQLRAELERDLLPLAKEAQIHSDYTMTSRKPEKGQSDPRSTCCFRF